jgi:hypothetical protein
MGQERNAVEIKATTASQPSEKRSAAEERAVVGHSAVNVVLHKAAGGGDGAVRGVDPWFERPVATWPFGHSLSLGKPIPSTLQKCQ